MDFLHKNKDLSQLIYKNHKDKADFATIMNINNIGIKFISTHNLAVKNFFFATIFYI